MKEHSSPEIFEVPITSETVILGTLDVATNLFPALTHLITCRT